MSLNHPRLWLAGSALLVLVILGGSLAPGEYVPPVGFWNSDKVNHALGYAGLTFWFTGIYSRSRYPQVVVGLLLLGVLVEVLQGAMSFGRERELNDMFANMVGIAIGLVLALTVTGGWAQKVETQVARMRSR